MDIDPVIAVRDPGDTVAKVENRTTPKILRKLIFRLLYRCNALPNDLINAGQTVCANFAAVIIRHLPRRQVAESSYLIETAVFA